MKGVDQVVCDHPSESRLRAAGNRQRAKQGKADLDMTPMVDVSFLLVIFFMVTASFSLQKSIAMPRQQAQTPSPRIDPQPQEVQVDVQIDRFGSFLVITPNWNLETPAKQRLVTALRDAVGESQADSRLSIHVHEMAKLRSLVDAMDAGTIAGYADLQVTQVEGF